MGCGDESEPETIRLAHELGRQIAQQGWIVLSGGRDGGVMRAVNRGAKEIPNSLTIGIIPSANAKPSADVDVVIVTDMHNARNNINVLSSDAVVACGTGGAGTVSEIALALKAGKQVILLGSDALSIEFFERIGRKMIHIAATVDEAISTIHSIRTRE